MTYTVTHISEITGSEWTVLFDKDFAVVSAVLKNKNGKETKVKISKKLDWMIWCFFNGRDAFSEFKKADSDG